MKYFTKLILLLFVLSSCASVKVEQLTFSSPKTGNCDLDVFDNENEVKRNFQVVCIIHSKTGNSIWNKRTAKAAIKKAKNKACGFGADAIIVMSSGQTDLKFYSYRRGYASMKGVKYL